MNWIPANEPPHTIPGVAMPIVAARKSKSGKWYVFGAVYLHEYELSEHDNEDETAPWTGFYVDYKHDYYDDYYERTDVHFWQPLPGPPEA